MTRSTWVVIGTTVIIAAVAAVAVLVDGADSGSEEVQTATSTTAALAPQTSAAEPVAVPANSVPPSSPDTTAARSEAPVIVTNEPTDPASWAPMASALSPVALPSDCPLPLDDPASMPNSPREYRGGTHMGIDFICEELGHPAVAALPGRVLIANSAFVDPAPEDRSAVLGTAQALGETPPWTLAMLYGRFVVLDHGVVDGAGHLVSVYAHFDEIDPAIQPGVWVDVGTPLGTSGNTGTSPGATGENDPRSLHLHWELYVDDVFFGAGLDYPATRDLYSQLFDVG